MTGRSEVLSCLGNQTSQGFADFKLLREAVWAPEGVRRDRRQMGHGLPSSSGPGRAHSSQSSQSRRGETHVPLLKNEIHTHHMQKETASHPKRTSKSAHFITYSVTEGGHLEKTLTLTLSAVILQLLLRVLPPRRFNFNPQPTRQKSEDCLVSGNRLKEQKALNL